MDAAPPWRDPAPFRVEAQGHTLTFYPHGADRLAALLALIETARESLHVFYYMFQPDHSGTRVRDALVAAIGRGVAVELLVDRFGSDAPDSFFAPIVAAGGRFAFFSPHWNVRYLIRNHQKMIIADEHRAMIGGFNVSDHYFAPPQDNGWCDLGLELEGPAVDQLLLWYRRLAAWTEQPRAQFRGIRQLVRTWQPGDGPVQVLVGGPTRIPSSWVRRVRRDLARAGRLDLVMAYYSPPLSMRRQIQRIARRGAARLIMAGKSDNGATIAAARAQYGGLLRAHASIFEFTACKLHMKLLVIDDAVYVGSANFDHRSIRLNLELMLRIEDQALAARVRQLVDALAQSSAAITPQLHHDRGTLLARLRWWAGWFLVSVLDYTVARRLNVGP